MIARSILLPAAAGLAAHAQLYVSPTGNDADPGTQPRPVRTLQHARDLARAQKAYTVILLGGAYRLTEPRRLGPEDSGVIRAWRTGQWGWQPRGPDPEAGRG
jgi:hypothetical protein